MLRGSRIEGPVSCTQLSFSPLSWNFSRGLSRRICSGRVRCPLAPPKPYGGLLALTRYSSFPSQSYYKQQFEGFAKYYYWKYIRPGSIKPLAHLMVLTGCVGYAVEWYALGQHHVAHKKAIVDKALAEHGHGH